MPPVPDHRLFPPSLLLEGLFCNRTFDMYACWPDGSPGTAVNISCPFYLPWFEKGDDDPLLPQNWKPGLSHAGDGRGSRGFPSCPLPGGEGPTSRPGSKGTHRARSRASSCPAPQKRVFGAEQSPSTSSQERGLGEPEGNAPVLHVHSETRAGEPQVWHRRAVGDGERQPALAGLLAVRGGDGVHR